MTCQEITDAKQACVDQSPDLAAAKITADADVITKLAAVIGATNDYNTALLAASAAGTAISINNNNIAMYDMLFASQGC